MLFDWAPSDKSVFLFIRKLCSWFSSFLCCCSHCFGDAHVRYSWVKRYESCVFLLRQILRVDDCPLRDLSPHTIIHARELCHQNIRDSFFCRANEKHLARKKSEQKTKKENQSTECYIFAIENFPRNGKYFGKAAEFRLTIKKINKNKIETLSCWHRVFRLRYACAMLGACDFRCDSFC